jgi:nitroreductase
MSGKTKTGQVLELATRRKTVRKFSAKKVPLDDILYALEAARQAPSGANGQPWRFIIITEPDLKKRIRDASEKAEQHLYTNVKGDFKEWLLNHGLSHEKPFLEEAPLLIAFLMDPSAMYAKESIWVAMGHLLLALEERGLSTITYTPSNTNLPLAELDSPQGLKLEAILPVGYSDDEKPKEPKKDLDEIAFMNNWGVKPTPPHSRAQTRVCSRKRKESTETPARERD